MQLSYLGIAMACCMCIITGARVKITLFSEVSWQKFITSVHQWKSTDTREAEIAQNAINTFGLELVRAPEILDAVPCQAGYHRKCYMRYTDKCKIERARKKPALVLQSSDQSDASAEHDQGRDEVAPKIRLLRSKTSHSRAAGSRSSHLLPVCCLICKKDKNIVEPHSRKRRKEQLVHCETITAGKLVTAAEMRKDEALLINIRGKDLVALEARYHKSCFKSYTRFLSKNYVKNPQEVFLYDEGYKCFCQRVVEERIVKNREILRLTNLNYLFKKCVEEEEGMKIPSYKTYSLKRRLLQSYPFLKFVKSSKSNESDLVFVEDLSTAEIAGEAVNDSSESADDADTDTDVRMGATTSRITTQMKCRPLYHAALALKNSIKDKCDTTPPLKWPPSSKELTLQAAHNIVPDELFNFLAWTTGITSDFPPHETMFV
uniref:uncharacterized protein n=1 Tax=Myxine glutinosa TaxID=7769 RepID=UPI00358FD2C1